MTFDEYQQKARKFAIYPDKYRILYPIIGLAGEVGEVSECIKKLIRDHDEVLLVVGRGDSELVEEKRKDLAKEIGDVFWCLANLCSDLGLSMGYVAALNLDKLASREKRGKLHGEGDNR